jgi:hypothetical protein
MVDTVCPLFLVFIKVLPTLIIGVSGKNLKEAGSQEDNLPKAC